MTIHTHLRNRFESDYLYYNGLTYYWRAKDATNLKQLITQLKFIVKQKHGIGDEEKVSLAFELILNSIQTLPELSWYKQNFSIPIINSKLNEIISTIKNGRTAKKTINRDSIEAKIKAQLENGQT